MEILSPENFGIVEIGCCASLAVLLAVVGLLLVLRGLRKRRPTKRCPTCDRTFDAQHDACPYCHSSYSGEVETHRGTGA